MANEKLSKIEQTIRDKATAELRQRINNSTMPLRAAAGMRADGGTYCIPLEHIGTKLYRGDCRLPLTVQYAIQQLVADIVDFHKQGFGDEAVAKFAAKIDTFLE